MNVAGAVRRRNGIGGRTVSTESDTADRRAPRSDISRGGVRLHSHKRDPHHEPSDGRTTAEKDGELRSGCKVTRAAVV